MYRVQTEEDLKVGEGAKEKVAVIESNVSLKDLMLSHSCLKSKGPLSNKRLLEKALHYFLCILI